jgi:glycosyl transferase family 25
MDVPILVINLEQDTDRLKKISQQLSNFTRIDAIKGSDIKDRSDIATDWCQKYCTASMIGCALSHIKSWLYIVEEKLPYAIVLEDDTMVCENFDMEVTKLLEKAPLNWDIILLGCFLCNEINNDYLSKLIMSIRAPFSKRKDIDRYFYIPQTWAGTHAYLLSFHGAQKLLKRHNKVSYHIDYVLSNFKDLKLYAVKNTLVTQSTTGKGSHNSYYLPFLWKYKIDHQNLALDFVLTMPLFQVGSLRVHLWGILKSLILLVMICICLYYVFKRKKKYVKELTHIGQK